MSIGCICGSHGIRENRDHFPLLPVEVEQVKNTLIHILKSLTLFLGATFEGQDPANQRLDLPSICFGHDWHRKPIERVDYILVVASPLELCTPLVEKLPDRRVQNPGDEQFSNIRIFFDNEGN